ncbi:MAG: tetratricopeptide repeat protein, partial [Pseudomonadota bacterium]
MGLLAELKRRNVFRVATLYLVFGWLILQIADVLFGVLQLPDFSLTLVAAILALGFIPAVVFAWVYEVTPEGIKRESEIDRDASITGRTGRKLDSATVFVLVGALALLGLRQLWLADEAPAEAASPATADAAGQSAPGDPGPAATPDPIAVEPTDGRASVAVLPFVNMSGDADNEFFSDGVSEELLNVLVRVDALRVPSRTSSFSFKGDGRKIAAIAEELGVEHVLEGSVRKAGDQVRITAQLVHAPTDAQLWSSSYTRTLDDIFAVQEEIALAIVDALQITLGTDELAGTGTRNALAYEHYLRGRFFWHRRTPEGFTIAEEELRTAVDLDPDYGDAWGALADIYVLLPEYSLAPIAESIPKARAALERALAINPESSRALATRGYLRGLHDFDHAAAEADFRDSIEIDPNYATAHQWFGEYLMLLRRFEEALASTQRALELEPLAPIMPVVVGNVHLAAGRAQLAIPYYDEALRIESQLAFALINKQIALITLDQIDDAR